METHRVESEGGEGEDGQQSRAGNGPRFEGELDQQVRDAYCQGEKFREQV